MGVETSTRVTEWGPVCWDSEPYHYLRIVARLRSCPFILFSILNVQWKTLFLVYVRGICYVNVLIDRFCVWG